MLLAIELFKVRLPWLLL